MSGCSRTTVLDVSADGDFGGMTVNERLFAAGLVKEFDTAVSTRNRRLAVDLLTQVALSRDAAEATVDAVMSDPARYGYPQV